MKTEFSNLIMPNCVIYYLNTTCVIKIGMLILKS